MGKSLREALAEQMVALRARGIAPETLPDFDEAEPPLPTNGYDEDNRPRKLGKRALAKRQGPRPAAARPAVSRTATATAPAPRRGPSRADSLGRSDVPAPAPVAPRPPSIGKMLQHRAEQRRQETNQREELRQQLGSVRGEELDDQALSAFLDALERETGALPPLQVVLEATRDAGSDAPEAVGNAVRRYYRRARR